MTNARIDKRLRLLEVRQAGERRLIVVKGLTAAEHESKIAKLKARGEASDRDLIVCIRKPAEAIAS